MTEWWNATNSAAKHGLSWTLRSMLAEDDQKLARSPLFAAALVVFALTSDCNDIEVFLRTLHANAHESYDNLQHPTSADESLAYLRDFFGLDPDNDQDAVETRFEKWRRDRAISELAIRQMISCEEATKAYDDPSRQSRLAVVGLPSAFA